MKPILFNTEMVRAILDGRKTVTRRVVKPQPEFLSGLVIPPYQLGDILYVRETWTELEDVYGTPYYAYKADDSVLLHSAGENFTKWRPSIHMPKEAARIFLRVTNIRVERLQDITDDDCQKEGIVAFSKDGRLYKYAPADEEGDYPIWAWSDTPLTPQAAMQRVWDTTIKKSDLDRYGWNANPWVWVIEFERISKEEAVK